MTYRVLNSVDLNIAYSLQCFRFKESTMCINMPRFLIRNRTEKPRRLCTTSPLPFSSTISSHWRISTYMCVTGLPVC